MVEYTVPDETAAELIAIGIEPNKKLSKEDVKPKIIRVVNEVKGPPPQPEKYKKYMNLMREVEAMFKVQE